MSQTITSVEHAGERARASDCQPKIPGLAIARHRARGEPAVQQPPTTHASAAAVATKVDDDADANAKGTQPQPKSRRKKKREAVNKRNQKDTLQKGVQDLIAASMDPQTRRGRPRADSTPTPASTNTDEEAGQGSVRGRPRATSFHYLDDALWELPRG